MAKDNLLPFLKLTDMKNLQKEGLLKRKLDSQEHSFGVKFMKLSGDCGRQSDHVVRSSALCQKSQNEFPMGTFCLDKQKSPIVKLVRLDQVKSEVVEFARSKQKSQNELPGETHCLYKEKKPIVKLFRFDEIKTKVIDFDHSEQVQGEEQHYQGCNSSIPLSLDVNLSSSMFHMKSSKLLIRSNKASQFKSYLKQNHLPFRRQNKFIDFFKKRLRKKTCADQLDKMNCCQCKTCGQLFSIKNILGDQENTGCRYDFLTCNACFSLKNKYCVVELDRCKVSPKYQQAHDNLISKKTSFVDCKESTLIPIKKEVSIDMLGVAEPSDQKLIRISTNNVHNKHDSSVLKKNPEVRLKKLTVDLTRFNTVTVKIDNCRMLTDDEVWAGVKGLTSKDVLVISPAVSLKVTLSGKEDVANVLVGNELNKNIIVAPISNAKRDRQTGYNTEGTHWSLVVVCVPTKNYYHLDSISGLNSSLALTFCKKMNTFLNFKPFKFSNRKCNQQKNNYSCGFEVIKNAIEQVDLLRKTVSCLNAWISRPVVMPSVNNLRLDPVAGSCQEKLESCVDNSFIHNNLKICCLRL